MIKITIFIISWLLIGFIFGLKINVPIMFELNRIDNENSEYDYLTFEDILFLIPLLILHSVLGILSLFIWLAMQIDNDEKIIVRRRSK